MRGRVAFAATLTLLVALAWCRVLDAPFTYDDRIEVVGNRTIRFLSEPGAIVTYNVSRALLILSYALNWELGGLDPRGYHVVSIAIHAVNALLAWRFAARLVSAERAMIAAALWALHPMTTEAVTYITGRSDALQATSWLLVLTGWVDYRRGDRRALLVVIVFMFAALFTKEIALLLPVALWALDRALGIPTRVRTWLPFVGVGAAAVALRVAVAGWPVPEVPRSALAQLLSQAEVWLVYVRLWLAPIGQSVLHDHPGEARLLGGLSLAIWGVAGGLAWRRGGLLFFLFVAGAAWLVASAALPLLETIAEHRAYLAGYFLLLGVVSVLPAPRWALAAVPVLFALTMARNELWRSEVALWQDATAKNPSSYRAAYGYGEALRYARDFRGCADAYRAATMLDPTNNNALINLGICRAENNDAAGARDAWEQVLKNDPGSCEAHNDLGTLASREGRPEAAEAAYASTLRWCPDDAIANLNLANLAYARADWRKAAFHYRSYLRVAEDGPGASLARERLGRMRVE